MAFSRVLPHSWAAGNDEEMTDIAAVSDKVRNYESLPTEGN
jgi:hypothetical protein